MTAATITDHPEGYLAEDNALLTFTSGETYTTKLSSIKSVQMCWGEADVGTAVPEAAVSGRTITITTPGITVTDKKLYITVKGRL